MDEFDWTDDELRDDLGISLSSDPPPDGGGAPVDPPTPWDPSGGVAVAARSNWNVALSKPRFLDKTRHALSIGLVALMAALVAVIAAWVMDDTPNENADKVLIAAISSLTGVLGTAVGFYFSQQSRSQPPTNS